MSTLEKTGKREVIEASDGGITLSLPIKIKRRSGRKLITLPQQETTRHRLWDTDPTPLRQEQPLTADCGCWSLERSNRSKGSYADTHTIRRAITITRN